MTNIERQQHWQAMIQQWRESGLSKTAFCKQHNIATSGVYHWLKRLAPDEIAQRFTWSREELSTPRRLGMAVIYA